MEDEENERGITKERWLKVCDDRTILNVAYGSISSYIKVLLLKAKYI